MAKKGATKKNSNISKNSKTREKYRVEKKVVYKKVKKKRFKLKMHTFLIALLCLYLVGCFIYYIINKPISNIYISGNNYYSDWKIIEMAGLENYPPSMLNPKKTIENRLESDILIDSVTIKKKFFTSVYIEIKENKPLFYDNAIGKTILADGQTVDDKFDTPVLVNEVGSNIYDEFIENMAKIDDDVFRKVSEIKYDPDEVDKERILFTMTDGNYAYVTMLKFDLINDYNYIVKEFNNKKGILYLNSGGYFKIIEN